MSNVCTPILVGVAFLVSEILPLFHLPSKRPKFPFKPWTIVHEGQKIELAKKFMQVEVDEICMRTMFGGLPNVGPGITRDNDNNYCYCSHLSFPCGQNAQVFLSSSHPFPEHLVSYHNTTSCLLGSCPSSPLIYSVILSHSPLLKIFCCLSHIFT